MGVLASPAFDWPLGRPEAALLTTSEKRYCGQQGQFALPAAHPWPQQPAPASVQQGIPVIPGIPGCCIGPPGPGIAAPGVLKVFPARMISVL